MDRIVALLKSADTGEFWIPALLALALALAALIAAFVFLRRLWAIAGHATSRIRSAAQGYVELEGFTRWIDDGEIHAPLSGRPCIWYRFAVEQRSESSRGGGRARWQTTEQATSNEFFYLVDDSGQCIVDPEGAQVLSSSCDVWYGDLRRPRRGPGPKPRWAFGRNYRYREELIVPGSALYALGAFFTSGGAGAALPSSDEVGHLLRDWKRDNAALLARFDANRDGNIDIGEWERARQTAWQEVMQSRAKSAPAPALDIMMCTGDPRRPFLLSAIPQDRIVAQLRWQSGTLLAAGMIGATTAIWAMLQRL